MGSDRLRHRIWSQQTRIRGQIRTRCSSEETGTGSNRSTLKQNRPSINPHRHLRSPRRLSGRISQSHQTGSASRTWTPISTTPRSQTKRSGPGWSTSPTLRKRLRHRHMTRPLRRTRGAIVCDRRRGHHHLHRGEVLHPRLSHPNPGRRVCHLDLVRLHRARRRTKFRRR